ncbi:site-specific DNA-methyltransferase [Luteithermobacter gelatinilyticus]|uniref:site-specific DNA-methyltransferase n=1 Tax=Luteithermobacter gelatinilyticus TaxID=2582913 RepID=UPI0011065B0C|nr:site-specific DNA-methyltransferase [Luteithermobacter gelatinilyticus]
MDKLKMHSPDLSQDNIAKIRELFPGCVTEARDEKTGKLRLAVDFDQLRQELSDHIVEGPQERYRLDWPGKRQALALANAPIAKTLRPSPQESVEFQSTQNLVIEGDNLEALKLVQETYLGAIKFIYIDPPYNTGNDFVYEDDFGASAQDFLIKSNQVAGSGERLVANTDSSGRFHSDWLDMIYPRVRIARNLLAEDGIIVASIDENEISNLRKVFDEVFGEDNLLFQITLLCNPKGRSQDKYVANCHEYLVGYSKQQLSKGAVNVPKSDDEIAANYKLKDKRGRYRELELRNTHREFGKHNRQNLYYPFFVSAKGEVALEPGDGRKPVYPDWEDGFEGCWTWGLEKARAQLDEIVAREVKGTWKIFRKNYATGDDGEATKQVKSIWTDKMYHTEKGQAAFNALFETREKIFQSPKSVDTLRELIRMATRQDSIVLDFFAGSGTTAHAVLAQNAEDGGNRRFVMVQIAEPTPEGSEARKAGFATVVEITKERIRRAGEKILESQCHPDWNRDVGFRVLKVDTSNMKDVYYRPDELKQSDLLDMVDNVKEDRTAEDLLFQVLVDWGVDLTLPIRRETVQGKTVFFVDDNALVACFDRGITEDLVKELASHEPLRVVFRDNGFVSDAVKINVEQIFRQLSPTTEVKAI